MQMSMSVTLLLLVMLVTVVVEVRPQVAAETVARSADADWGPSGVVQRTQRGFRFGGADRFSHGFGRRRRIDDVELTHRLDSGKRTDNILVASPCKSRSPYILMFTGQ